MAEQAAAAPAGPIAPAAEDEAPLPHTPLQKKVLAWYTNMLIAKTHIDHPEYNKAYEGGKLCHGDAKVKKNLAHYAEWISKKVACTEQEFSEKYEWAKAKYQKERTLTMGRKKALKTDLYAAAAMWKISSVKELHTELVTLKYFRTKPKPCASLLTTGLMALTESLNQREGQRQAEFSKQVIDAAEAKVPELKAKYEAGLRDNKKKDQELDAEWAKLDKRREQIEVLEEDTGEIVKLKTKNPKHQRDIALLEREVERMETKLKQKRSRKKGRKAERERNTLFNQHSATSTISPQVTTTKRRRVTK